uniref:CUB domain-containing protein 1-like n=1 Tax=Pristiophorus japonicus TaxID=55135 RepID=UPI00398E6621
MAADRALVLILLLVRILETESEKISVTADKNVTITLKQAPGSVESSECLICIAEEECYKEYELSPEETLLFNFTCIDPEHNFRMEVVKQIGEDTNLEDVFPPPELPQLNRTFVWNISVPYKVGVEMRFLEAGLWQTDSDSCPDSVTYTINGRVRSNIEEVHVGTFCLNGTISNVKVQGKTLITLALPWTETTNDAGFQLFFVSPIKKFSVVNVILQPGPPVYFMSPNWPLGFPNDELMSWKFSIPLQYHANVTVENYFLPVCVKREAGMFYGPSVLGKSDKFHTNFILTLQNCDMDRSNPDILKLRFKVELLADYGERIEIKLNKEDGVALTFKQMSTDDAESSTPFCICQFPVSSNCASELQLEPGDHVNVSFHFECNRTQDVLVEATKNVSCQGLDECSVSDVGLVLPGVLSMLPVSHQAFRWVLNVPPRMTIQLVSKRLKLRQLLPDQSCDGNVQYTMSTLCENSGRFVIGHFCPDGAMEKIQTANSVLLEVLTLDAWNTTDLDISLSFIPRVTEDYIMDIVPTLGSPVYLLTPNWGPGVPNKLTASWDIAVPDDHVVELTFLEQEVPSCEHGHVVIGIVEQHEDATLMSYRETDELPESAISLAHRFWLNVSNCETSSEHLNLMFHVLLKEKEDEIDTLTIVAAAAGGLALLVIIAVVCCCVRKRKRQRAQLPLGIYNPGVNSRVPGRRGKFGKGRQDNESHIYAVIDEDRVYTDHFGKSGMLSIPEVDVYRPFEGPMDSLPPMLPPPRSTTPKDASPEAVPMVSNDLYTFSVRKQELEKSNGEMVTFLGNGEKDATS